MREDVTSVEIAHTAMCAWEFIATREVSLVPPKHRAQAEAFFEDYDSYISAYGTASARLDTLKIIAPYIETMWAAASENIRDTTVYDWEFVPETMVRFVRFTPLGSVEFIPG